MTAEAIARVVADIRGRRVRPHPDERITELGLKMFDDPGTVIVDATAIYDALVDRDDPVFVYEDHPCIAPPWPHGAICYVNGHGNVIVMHTNVMAYTPGEQAWEPAEPVDWERVRWRVTTMVWIGGRGENNTVPRPTQGPVHMWDFAIYEDGEAADLHWIHIVPDYPLQNWDMAHLTLLGALNFMNCRNIDVVEPVRPRQERRRIERAAPGVTVKELMVFPKGISARTAGDGQRLHLGYHGVRGHFAHYGACCAHHEPRGLLFGKLTGRFWVPPHARGTTEEGKIEKSYVLSTEER